MKINQREINKFALLLGSSIALVTGCSAGKTPTNDSSTPATYAYVANSGESTISIFKVGSDGNLAVITPPVSSGGNNPDQVRISPLKKYAIVVNRGSENMAIFKINPANGNLVFSKALPTGINPLKFMFSPNGKCIYISNFGTDDESTAFISAYSIDEQNETVESVGTIKTASTHPEELEFTQDGKYAYVPNFSSDNLLNIYQSVPGSCQLNTLGTVSTKVNTPGGGYPWSVTLSPSNKYLYVSNLYTDWGDSSDIAEFEIQSDGLLKPISTQKPYIAPGYFPKSVVFDQTGKYAYVLSSQNIMSGNKQKLVTGIDMYQFNPSDGSLTDVVNKSGESFIVTNSDDTWLMSFAPSAPYLYVPSNDENLVKVLKQREDGSLKQLTDLTVKTESNPETISFDATGTHAYVNNHGGDSISIYSVNKNTGALTKVGAPVQTGMLPDQIAFYSESK